jgi:hypothetical protein
MTLKNQTMNAINGRKKLLMVPLFLFFQCQSYNDEQDKEFEKHISEANEVVYDSDALHPSCAYLKNGKIRGIKFTAHPECGDYTKRYFFSDQGKIEKVAIHKDFYNSSCGETFDSVYVVDFIRAKVLAAAGSGKEKKIENGMLKQETIIVADYRKEIRTWKIKQ